MQLIPGVSEKDANPLVKFFYWYSKRTYGAVLDPLAVLAHHPRLLFAGAAGEAGVAKAATALPARVRELAVYRVATKLGCSWCVDFGTMLQRNEGLDIDRLKEIDDYASSEKFTEIERLVIAYADAMTNEPMTVTQEQVTELDRRLGHKGMVELTHMIALENQRTRFNHALGITAQGFTSGEACRVPTP